MKEPSWKMRRRAVFGTLVFAAGIILMVTIRWDDTELAQTLVLSMSALMGSIIAAYTGFATWQDRGAIQNGMYTPESSPTPTVDAAVIGEDS